MTNIRRTSGSITYFSEFEREILFQMQVWDLEGRSEQYNLNTEFYFRNGID